MRAFPTCAYLPRRPSATLIQTQTGKNTAPNGQLGSDSRSGASTAYVIQTLSGTSDPEIGQLGSESGNVREGGVIEGGKQPAQENENCAFG